MNTTYAGLDLDLGHTVWIFDTDAETPIFHSADSRVAIGGRHDGGMILVTACGLPVNSEDRGGYRSAVHLPPKHAVRFARPCATCWAELRAQRSLWQKRRTDRRDAPTQDPLTA